MKIVSFHHQDALGVLGIERIQLDRVSDIRDLIARHREEGVLILVDQESYDRYEALWSEYHSDFDVSILLFDAYDFASGKERLTALLGDVLGFKYKGGEA